MKYIYPNIEIKQTIIEQTVKFNLFTTLRKIHSDGKYYLINFSRYSEYKIDREDNSDVESFKIATLNQFHSEVYFKNAIGSPMPYLRDQMGNPIDVMDENQETEKDRIIKLLGGNANGNTNVSYSKIFDQSDMD